MRREPILIAAAAVLGLAGGYGWMVMTARPARPPARVKATMMPIPPSPEEEPGVLDQEWTAQADDTNAAAAAANAAANAETTP